MSYTVLFEGEGCEDLADVVAKATEYFDSVCTSQMGEDMADLVVWIRENAPGCSKTDPDAAADALMGTPYVHGRGYSRWDVLKAMMVAVQSKRFIGGMKAQIKKASAVAERLGYAERVRYSPRIDTEGLFPEPKIEVLVDRTS